MSEPVKLEDLLTSDRPSKQFQAVAIKGKTADRNERDFYQTPLSITHQLLENEPFDFENETFLEPAHGHGAITSVLQGHSNNVTYYDIEKDFFTETESYDNIITNPPFNLANRWIEKCKQVSNKKFALLLPINYITSQERYDGNVFMDDDFKLETMYTFTRATSMTSDDVRPDGKYPAGMLYVAWYVWNKEYKGDTKLKWINNNPYIARKRNKK